jgi:hypothetical protein
MSVRVSESWTARNGHRRSVSMGLGTYVLGSLASCFGRGLLFALFALPFLLYWWALLASFWVCAELVLFTVTGAAAIAAVLRHEGRAADINLTRTQWHLYGIGLKGARR